MSLIVKNTTFHKLFEVFCPHYCIGCGDLGCILCERCKNDNSCEELEICLNCGMVVKNGCCQRCAMPYDRGFAVGRKEGVLEKCVSDYKYKSVRALKRPLADMLSSAIPCLPENTIVVPVPTNYKHVRMRGLDHTLLVAKELAKIRGWTCQKIVKRVKDNVQVGTDAKTRKLQALDTYSLVGEVDAMAGYVVIDDVWTTGSTMTAVCGVLRGAGAKDITAIVLARAQESLLGR